MHEIEIVYSIIQFYFSMIQNIVNLQYVLKLIISIFLLIKIIRYLKTCRKQDNVDFNFLFFNFSFLKDGFINYN